MFVLIFSTTFVWNISHSKKNWARYYQKCISAIMQSAWYSCQIVMELVLSRETFEKILKYQISLKSAQWDPSWRMRTDGQTDKHVAKLTVAVLPPLN
jgi:hypothetical protein